MRSIANRTLGQEENGRFGGRKHAGKMPTLPAAAPGKKSWEQYETIRRFYRQFMWQ
jgi:hypothetical protein